MNKSTHLRPDNMLGHEGELILRERLPSSYIWNERNLPHMLRQTIPSPFAQFIESQIFFFIATASQEGHCDASFRGREYGVDGKAQLVAKVLDHTTLVFPDFSGNGLYQSLGNILVNPHIGMIFIDFSVQRRVRVNGIAEIVQVDDISRQYWPDAQAVVRVHVEQVYGNCNARIPRMQYVEGSDARF